MKRALDRSGWRRVVGVAVLALPACGGCVKRTIHITSDPPGALVHLNDEEVGRTPCDVSFLHYGTYDVRLTKEGYEPYLGPAEADPPLYDLPGPDFFAEVAPVRFESDVHWHFQLLPVRDDPAAMIDRARQLRARLPQPVGEDAPAALEAGTETAPADNDDTTEEATPAGATTLSAGESTR